MKSSVNCIVVSFLSILVLCHTATWKTNISGLWSVSSNWLESEVPGMLAVVQILLSRETSVIVDVNVTIAQLDLSGAGLLHIKEGCTVHVEELIFNGGRMSCNNNGISLIASNSTKFGSNNTKYISNCRVELGTDVLWSDGDVALSGSFLRVDGVVHFSPSCSDRNSCSLREDLSGAWFDQYSGYVLNLESNLRRTLPVPSSVADLVLLDLVRSPGYGIGADLWPLVVQLDSSSSLFYESFRNYSAQNYNATFLEVTQEECSILCLQSSGGWCRSFDYSRGAALCQLSPFIAADIGGLTFLADRTVPVEAVDMVHFELRGVASDLSNLVVNGNWTISSNVDNLRIEANVELTKASYLSINSDVTFFGRVALQSNSSVQLNMTQVRFRGQLSSLQASPWSRIYSAQLISQDAISFEGGSHSIFSFFLTPLSSLQVTDFGFVELTTLSTDRTLTLDDLTISNGGTLFLANNALNSDCQTEAIVLHANSIVMRGGHLQGPALNISANQVIIDEASGISSSGLGPVLDCFGGNGQSYEFGASGGSHASRGGPSYVDTLGIPYGDVIFPYLPGSRGGWGSDIGDSLNPLASLGGGVVTVTCKELQVNGTIETDGSNGENGGGGGAGGSLLINCDSVDGSGRLSARGGDGGSAGGLISGGGGSGGRISVISSNFKKTQEVERLI